jgi:CHAT domain-containing protein
MKKIRLIFQLLFILSNLHAQNNCEQLFTKFTEEYKARIRDLHQNDPTKGDSIYQNYWAKIKSLQCNKYDNIKTFTNAYNHLTFYGLNSPTKTFAYLNELKDITINKNDTVALFVYNRLGVYKLRADDFPGMISILNEGYDFAMPRFDSTFSERRTLVANIALYYDWMNLEESSIEVLKHNENLVNSGKIKNFDFTFQTYSSMNNYHIELGNKDEAERYLTLLKTHLDVEPKEVQQNYEESLNELWLEFYLAFGQKDQAIQIYKTKLSHKPNSIDYDEVMLYMDLQLMNGELDKFKAGLDTLNKYYQLRNMPPNSFYNIKKNRYEIMYYKTIGDKEKVTELLRNLLIMFNNNLEHILYQNEYDQIRTTSLLNRISSRAINASFEKEDSLRAKLDYNLQSNLKYITNNYLRNKIQFINSSANEQLKQMFSQQKNILKKLSDDDSNILRDSLNSIQLDIHRKYLQDDIAPEIISCNDILSSLPKDVTYIEFHEAKQGNTYNMYAYIFNKDELKMIHLPEYITAKNLLNNFNSGSYISNKDVNQKVYNFLLADIAKYINKTNKIFITPDGLFNNLALEILSPTGKLNDAPLLNLDITYTTSGSEFIKSVSKQSNLNSIRSKLLAVGDINYQCSNSQSSILTKPKSVLRSDNRKPLLGSKIELARLKELSGKHNSTFNEFSACNATKNAIMEGLEDKNIDHFHLATHGFFMESDNSKKAYSDKMRSRVLLARDAEDIEYLSAYEVSNLNLSHIDHCFLSACNTSLGPYLEGQGNFSIAQAFKIAGVKKVISTLWEIPDEITAEFVDHYYTNYMVNHNPAAALKFAKSKLKLKYAPKNWAAFRLLE